MCSIGRKHQGEGQYFPRVLLGRPELHALRSQFNWQTVPMPMLQVWCLRCLHLQYRHAQCRVLNHFDLFDSTDKTPICVANCSANCKTCLASSSAMVCKECLPGFQQVGALCLSLDNCATYDEKSALCTKCPTTTYFNLQYDGQVESNQPDNGEGVAMCSPC
jgi:hypothetical protein